MSSTVVPPLADLLSSRRKRWTREECQWLVESGKLEAGRFELLEGEIVFKMGKKQPHVFVTLQLFHALIALFGADVVQSQDPIALSSASEPEPDIAVLTRPRRHYLTAGTPGAGDVRLVCEVSEATLREDTTLKATLYARAGIPEYWVVDIAGRCVIVHRSPQGDSYRSIVTVAAGGSLAPLAAPTATIAVDSLLP